MDEDFTTPSHDAPWQLAIRSMLADAAFCFPIAAAQVQYRDRYYGMSAASLLEDLFFDSLVYFTRQKMPGLVPQRPPRGEKGYDYEIGGQKISHKVGQRATEISVLWDATKKITRWSAAAPIIYHSFDANGRQRTLTDGTVSIKGKTITSPAQTIPDGSKILVVRWHADGTAERLSTFDFTGEDSLRDISQFWKFWTLLGDGTRPANEIELLVVNGIRAVKSGLDSVDRMTISSETRPGIYFLDPDLLKDVELTSNNRGQLIPAATVRKVMDSARASGRFVPLPTWFSLFSLAHPPSLYLAQKIQFDDMFR
jgi:hypothetical protein